MWICNMYNLDFFQCSVSAYKNEARWSWWAPLLGPRSPIMENNCNFLLTYYCTILIDKRNCVVLLRIVPLLTQALSTNNFISLYHKPIIYGWWIEQSPMMIWLNQSHHLKAEGLETPERSLAFIRKIHENKKEISKADQSQSESRDVMFEIQATILNPVCFERVSSKC